MKHTAVLLQQVAAAPEYGAAAPSTSKATIFVFVVTFAYMALFSGTSPGVIGGAIFFCAGFFVSSLAIAMPLSLLRAKFPRIGRLAAVTEVAATILIARFVYLWIFASASAAPIVNG